MKKSFIAKLETDNYYIGSFDSYLEESKELLKNNNHLADEEVDNIIKSMPTTTRASIVDKETHEYIGFIGIKNSNGELESADLVFETVNDLKIGDLKKILKIYLEYLKSSLSIRNITKINDVSNNLEVSKQSIILPKHYIKNVITNNDIEIVKSWGIEVPNLKYGRAIYLQDKFLGIIGLTAFQPANKRANLNIYLDPSLTEDFISYFASLAIDEYLEYAHEQNVYNIAANTKVSSLDNQLFSNSNMQKFAEIPYTEKTNDILESRILYQHTPNIKTEIDDIESGIIYPSVVDKLPDKSELLDKILLDDSYTLVRPSSFLSEGINLDHVIDGHIEAMKDRNKFAIPLGEDKYFLQRGNERYGIYKSVSNFSYVIIDKDGNYAGYVNILRSEGRHAEIEIGVTPNIQAHGLGRLSLEAFYKELFRIGYASVTSCVFSFNTPSIKLHEKVAEFNGIRIKSYYANNKIWDMNYYTAINPEITKIGKSK